MKLEDIIIICRYILNVVSRLLSIPFHDISNLYLNNCSTKRTISEYSGLSFARTRDYTFFSRILRTLYDSYSLIHLLLLLLLLFRNKFCITNYFLSFFICKGTWAKIVIIQKLNTWIVDSNLFVLFVLSLGFTSAAVLSNVFRSLLLKTNLIFVQYFMNAVCHLTHEYQKQCNCVLDYNNISYNYMLYYIIILYNF